MFPTRKTSRTKIRKLLTLVFVPVFVIGLMIAIRKNHQTLSPVQAQSIRTTDKDFFSVQSIPSADSVIVEPLFKEKPLVIWTNDYHATPVHDLKHLLRPFGVRIIDKNVHPYCYMSEWCEGGKTLKVINLENVMDLNAKLIPQFYNVYRDDLEMKSVDAFLCFHPASICELFEPFNKSVIIIASTRYELGRFKKKRWTAWNKNLIRYASHPWNVVAANNLYDTEYIKYFTGIQPQLLPSFCDYSNLTYSPTRKGFLVAFTRNQQFLQSFIKLFKTACKAVNCAVEITPVKEKYGDYKYTDLVAHMGMVYVPYQVSVMSLFEQYRMNIPLFFPSIDLLTKWQDRYVVMFERTWSGVYGLRPKRSAIDPHPSQISAPDPNNEWDEKAIRYWIKFADFYQWPHIMYYKSIPHLVEILENIKPSELEEISGRMKSYNCRIKRELMEKWKTILTTIAQHSSNRPH